MGREGGGEWEEIREGKREGRKEVKRGREGKGGMEREGTPKPLVHTPRSKILKNTLGVRTVVLWNK